MSYRTQRTIAFSILVIFGAFSVLIGILSLLGVGGMESLDPTKGEFWYRKLTTYLPVAVILGVAYSFTVKNYRIYSNMLDQYKHRKLVAQTAQGIIYSFNSDDSSIRNTMTAAAAQALFEHKVTGHLSKKEAETGGLLELIGLATGQSKN